MTKPPPLTIAFHTLDYPPDEIVSSVGYYTERLANALAERDHVVHVLVRGPEDSRIQKGNLIIHRLRPTRAEIPTSMNMGSFVKMISKGLNNELIYRRRLAKKISELIQNEGIQIFEAVDSAAEALFYPVKRFPKIPFIVRLHGPTAVWELFDRNVPEIGRRIIWLFERHVLLKATHLTTPSTVAADFFRREMLLGSRPLYSFPNPPLYDVPEKIEGYGDPNMVLFVGRVNFHKGADKLIEAVPAVIDELPKTHFVLIGPDAPTSTKFRSMQEYLLHLLPEKYHSSVEFTGYKTHNELVNYYNQAALCVFPSIFESFGYTCLEAMSFGKALIGSSKGATADMLDNGRCGLLYTPPNVEQLSNHIITLLKEDKLRESLGKAARQRVLEHYSLEATVDTIEDFYYQVTREKP